MSFRQYGGINYASKNNIVKSHYTNASNLSVMNKVGQPNSVINVDSGLYGLGGDITFQQNGTVPKYGIIFSDGSSQFTAGGGGGGDRYWQNIIGDDIRNTNSGNVQVSTTLSVGGDTTLSGNLSVSGSTSMSNLTAYDTTVNKLIANSTLNVTGSTTLGSTLGVTGATTLNNGLSVTVGSTSLNDSLGVAGATTLGGSLVVTGATTLNNGLSVVTNGSTNVQITNSDMTLTGVYPPPSTNSVVTKQYVDNISLGFQIKQACQCAATTDITLSGNPINIDGFTSFVNGVTRVLVWNQTNKIENGIYIVNTGSWDRSDDLPDGAIATNVFVFVQSGTDNGKTSFLQNSDPATIIVGVDELIFYNFSQFEVSVGANLTFEGGVLNVNPALSSMTSIQFGSSALQTEPFIPLSLYDPSGIYTNATINVNSYGQITSATSGSGGASEWTLDASNNLYPNLISTNVAIGTNNAGSDKLVVQGSLRVNNAATNLGGTLTVTGSSTLSGIYIGYNTDSAAQDEIRMYPNIWMDTITGNTMRFNNNADGNFIFICNSNEFLRIDSTKVTITRDALINGLTVGRGKDNNPLNTALGYDALYTNLSGNYNTAVGYAALYTNSTGQSNTAVGYAALYLNTTGDYNTALGYDALYLNSSGKYNTAVGWSALNLNSTGKSNSAFGYSALLNSTGQNNSAFGVNSLLYNTSSFNCAFGSNSLENNSTGISNCAFGFNSLINNSTGSGNCAFGYNSGSMNNFGINNTFLGSGTNSTTDNLNNSTAIGYQASVDVNDKIRLGNGFVTVIEGNVAFTHPSDARDKTNFVSLDAGLNFINELKPIRFDWNQRGGGLEGRKDVGFTAQDLLLAQEKTKISIPNLVDESNPDKYHVMYTQLIPVLVKAVQEMSSTITRLEAEINELKITKQNI